jgi:hypothetical protein
MLVGAVFTLMDDLAVLPLHQEGSLLPHLCRRLLPVELLDPLVLTLGAHVAALVVIELVDGVHVLDILLEVLGGNDAGAPEPDLLLSLLRRGDDGVGDGGALVQLEVGLCRQIHSLRGR